MSLFYTDQDHNIQSVMCEKTNKFILEDDSFHSWWRMRTVVGEAEVIGSASRLHFYPAESTKEGENQVHYSNVLSMYIHLKDNVLTSFRFGILMK